MNGRTRLNSAPAIWLSVVVLAVVMIGTAVVLYRGSGRSADSGGANSSAGPSRPPGPENGYAYEVAAADRVTCPTATITVYNAASLAGALAKARPGDSIRIADGTYVGRFKAATSGNGSRPIFLCGGPGAVIDGRGITEGYALHLNGADYWRLVGFTVRNSQKGVMADEVRGVVLQDLTVEKIGDEAIHLRKFSSDNVVQGNTIRNTGLRRAKFGEGIYIGTAKSNWCSISDCKPDQSDRNIVRGNRISATTAESVDIKEGTTAGVLVGNTFDGSGIDLAAADSWVDVKGNGWLIEGNAGTDSPVDGYQTHEILDGWGTRNIFKTNTAVVRGTGWGFHLAPRNENKVACDNKVTEAAKGLANVRCG